MKTQMLMLLAAFGLTLSACEPAPKGKPVLRTELGKGEEEAAALRAEAEAQERAKLAETSVCSDVTFEGVSLTHCIADPEAHRITTALAPETAKPFRSLPAYAQSIVAESVAFAMNGGMYDGEGMPIGYYVEESNRLAELNRNDGPGNFHMKPNGVFFGSGGRWQVMAADTFYNTVGDRPEFGTQSGPMLVIGGKLHPEFQDDGPSKTTRNGVGVAKDGKAHFVIANAPISFGQLARYYRDELKVENALYLDGTVSAMWDPAKGRLDKRGNLGPLLVVTKREGGQ